MTEAHISVMFKKVCVIALLILQSVVFFSCSKDEPVNPENTETPTTSPGGEDDNPNEGNGAEDVDVVITGNTVSNGAQFSRIDANTFMLDYVKYQIVSGHINVIGCDNIEIGASREGKVAICRSVTVEGVRYVVRCIAMKAFYCCDRMVSISLPNTITYIGSWAFSRCSNMTTFTIPDCEIEFDTHCFENCVNLRTIVWKGTVSYHYSFPNMFYGTSIESVYFFSPTVPSMNYILDAIPHTAYVLPQYIEKYMADPFFSRYFEEIKTFNPETLEY